MCSRQSSAPRGLTNQSVAHKRDGFELTEIDQQIAATYGMRLGGHFLIDRDGIVRWVQIEAAEGIGGLVKFPSVEEIFQAARGLSHSEPLDGRGG